MLSRCATFLTFLTFFTAGLVGADAVAGVVADVVVFALVAEAGAEAKLEAEPARKVETITAVMILFMICPLKSLWVEPACGA